MNSSPRYNPCPEPGTGACCLPDGSCTDDITPGDCEAVLGTYQGDDVRCSSVSCPQPAEPTQTQLAGNSLVTYPYFEYVRAFNENEDERVRGIIAWSLGRLGGTKARVALEGFFKGSEDSVRKETEQALETH